jgi:hypothetical protein
VAQSTAKPLARGLCVVLVISGCCCCRHCTRRLGTGPFIHLGTHHHVHTNIHLLLLTTTRSACHSPRIICTQQQTVTAEQHTLGLLLGTTHSNC